MQPLALVLNIAIIVSIIGIVVYWVRRFAVFLGFKAIQPDVLQIAVLLKADPYRHWALEEDVRMGLGYWTRANSEVAADPLLVSDQSAAR